MASAEFALSITKHFMASGKMKMASAEAKLASAKHFMASAESRMASAKARMAILKSALASAEAFIVHYSGKICASRLRKGNYFASSRRKITFEKSVSNPISLQRYRRPVGNSSTSMPDE